MASLNTIRTNSWTAIYTYLQTTNPISTNNIYSSMNSKLVATVGYPLVIIFPPEVSFNKLTANGRYLECPISFLIEVYYDHAGSAKTLADNVTAKLIAGRSTFAGERMMNMNIESAGTDTWADGEKKIHRIAMNVTFRFVDTDN